MPDIALALGFVLIVAGVWVSWGLGPALLTAGAMLFLAGGLASRTP